ncbi:RlpA-like double-psi beta-barrel-protein domain-containing protein-containing protein [Parasitella parasitica]|nr:RlpA-like double-psi beta-barrel-protein domain-containing protein-containing protein [Parasitella parasitica]
MNERDIFHKIIEHSTVQTDISMLLVRQQKQTYIKGYEWNLSFCFCSLQTMVTIRFYAILLILAANNILFASTAPLDRRMLKASKLLKGVKGKLFSGSGTYYQVGSGSCGTYDTNSELVVAVNKAQMDNGSNPNNNPRCDKMVTITGDKGTVTAKVVDTCPACANGALDMSPTTFKKVCGDLAEGVCNINWKFL